MVCLAASICAAQSIDVGRILTRVENRYNRPRTMQLQFQQTYTGMGMSARVESGDLYLSKPRRMRWEYKVPEGKLSFPTVTMFTFTVPARTGWRRC